MPCLPWDKTYVLIRYMPRNNYKELLDASCGCSIREVNRKPEIRFSVLKSRTGSISLATGFQIFYHFAYIKLHNDEKKIPENINSCICMILTTGRAKRSYSC